MKITLACRTLIVVLAGVLPVLLLLLQPAHAQLPVKPKSAGQNSAKPVTLEALAQQADVVALGKVGAMASEWTGNRSRIQTRVTIRVEEAYKGSSAGGSVTLIVPGGEVDGVGEVYSHSDRFLRDEEVIVFARADKQGNLRLAPGDHGKLAVTTDKISGRRMVPSVGVLADVKARIVRAMNTAPDPKQ